MKLQNEDLRGVFLKLDPLMSSVVHFSLPWFGQVCVLLRTKKEPLSSVLVYEESVLLYQISTEVGDSVFLVDGQWLLKTALTSLVKILFFF